MMMAPTLAHSHKKKEFERHLKTGFGFDELKNNFECKIHFFQFRIRSNYFNGKTIFLVFYYFFKHCKKPICQQIFEKYIQNKCDKLLNYGRQICWFGLIEMIANHNTWQNDGENK